MKFCKKKGQSSLEYMLVVGISVMMLLAISYYFFVERTLSDSDTLEQNVQQVGKEMVKNAEEVYFSTGAVKKTLELDIPEEVKKVYVEDEKYLVFELEDGQQRVFKSSAPLHSFYTGHEAYSGVVTVEKIDDDVIICATRRGQCQKLSPESNCTDGLDNDLDGRIDGEDLDCCPDDQDGDTYPDMFNTSSLGELPLPYQSCTGEGSGFSSDDCNDSVEDTHPDATEFCDGVDNDCDGTIDEGCDVYREIDICAGGICAYIETGNEESDNLEPGKCRPGYEALISLSSYEFNSHAMEAGADPAYPYDLCYNLNTEMCRTECKIVNGPCDADWTKIFGIFDISLPSGSHVEAPSENDYDDNVCCKAICGDITCTIGSDPIQPCPADYTCMMSVSDMTNGHIGSCDPTSMYDKRICCKVD